MPKPKNSKCLSLNEKAKIIEELSRGMTVTALSKKYGVAKSTICSFKKKRDKILCTVSHTLKPSKKCTLKTSAFPRMEKKLYKWFLKQRERHLPVSGEILKQKALNLYSTSNPTSNVKFIASDGWLQRFKSRYGIRLLKITGEKLSSQPELVDPFKEKLTKLIEECEFSENQIYNADETGLYWKMLPDKTYVALNEKTAPGLKIAKQRLTFLGCTNATGFHKLKELVIGKSKNPRCFKNFKNPIIYKNTKNAWMTGEIFKEWFFQHFVPEVKQFLRQQNLPQKAVLLLDNAPSHPPEEELKTEDGMIFTMFMPPNVTPLIQPMDQNVLRLTKLYYRKSLLSSIVPTKQNISQELNKLTLKNAILHLHSAWQKLKPRTISKCWRNILSKNCEFTNEDNIPLGELKELWKDKEIEAVVLDTITLLQAIQPDDQYTASDILEWNMDTQQNKEDQQNETLEDSNDDDTGDTVDQPDIQKVTHREAIQALKISLEWAEHNDVDISDIISIKKTYEKAILSHSAQKQKQTKITSFLL